MKKLIQILSIVGVCLISNNLYANNQTIKLTGAVHKKFNKQYVQVKDEYGQILKIPRSSFPENFKVKQGAIFSFEIKSNLVKQASSTIYVRKKVK